MLIHGQVINTIIFILFCVFKISYDFKKLGWSIECFSDWYLYLKLALPGSLMIALEWFAWEFGNLEKFIFYL